MPHYEGLTPAACKERHLGGKGWYLLEPHQNLRRWDRHEPGRDNREATQKKDPKDVQVETIARKSKA